MDQSPFTFQSAGLDLPGLADCAERMAVSLGAGDVIALWGDLGAGKTTFARFLIEARARAAGETVTEVPSPTFTLVQLYELPSGDIWHFDLYRLQSADEAEELGLEEAFADGVTLIEWPERLGQRLPGRRVDVRLSDAATPDRRAIQIEDLRGVAAHA